MRTPKATAFSRGELTVSPDLPDHLRQGLFAKPATYPVIARFSSTAGAIRSDQVRGVRGLAIKVLGVHGPRALPDDPEPTQDFVFVNRSEFPFADVRALPLEGDVGGVVVGADAGHCTHARRRDCAWCWAGPFSSRRFHFLQLPRC